MAPDWSTDGGDHSGGRSSSYGDGYSAEYRAAPRSEYGDSRAYPTTGQWPSSESAQWSAAYPVYGMPAGSQSQSPQARYSTGFAEQRVWTDGRTALRARRRRRIRNLFVTAIVLLAVLGGPLVVYARPDLCPVSACKSLNTLMHHYVPSLGGFGAAALVPLSTAPTSVKLPATAGSSASTKVTLTNPGATAESWHATTDLAWLSVDPASGTLDPNASVAVNLTAKPKPGSVNPGTYTSSLTIIGGGTTTVVPITLVVTEGARLHVSPASLAFHACGTQQTLTVTNFGDATLMFTASPSVSSVLSVSESQQSLAAGASTAVQVTLSCAAAMGQPYDISLISNGGSTLVSVVYA